MRPRARARPRARDRRQAWGAGKNKCSLFTVVAIIDVCVLLLLVSWMLLLRKPSVACSYVCLLLVMCCCLCNLMFLLFVENKHSFNNDPCKGSEKSGPVTALTLRRGLCSMFFAASALSSLECCPLDHNDNNNNNNNNNDNKYHIGSLPSSRSPARNAEYQTTIDGFRTGSGQTGSSQK